MVTLEQNLNSLGQYGRRNNLVLSGIPESIPDNQLENTVSSILSDTGVSMQSEEKRPATDLGKLTGRPNPKRLSFFLLIENIVKRPCLIRKNSAISIITSLILMLTQSCTLMKI